MTPTKVRSAAYRARKKVRDSDVLVRLERYERALQVIAKEVYLGLGDMDGDGSSYLGNIEEEVNWALGQSNEQPDWRLGRWS